MVDFEIIELDDVKVVLLFEKLVIDVGRLLIFKLRANKFVHPLVV